MKTESVIINFLASPEGKKLIETLGFALVVVLAIALAKWLLSQPAIVHSSIVQTSAPQLTAQQLAEAAQIAGAAVAQGGGLGRELVVATGGVAGGGLLASAVELILSALICG